MGNGNVITKEKKIDDYTYEIEILKESGQPANKNKFDQLVEAVNDFMERNLKSHSSNGRDKKVAL